jgi:hypothetical protein
VYYLRSLGLFNPLKPKREKRKYVWVVREATFNRENIVKFTVMKVPRQCSFVLVMGWRGGKNFGSEEGREETLSKDRS